MAPDHEPMIDVRVDVPVAMRDGVILRADVYVPQSTTEMPVLLRRTPYLKRTFSGDAMALAQGGYIVVVQDIRGRGKSDGDFVWSFSPEAKEPEAADGYDSVEWAGALRGSSGEVGTWGHSYDAWTSWVLAPLKPPSLRSVYAAGMSPGILDMTRGIFDTGRRLEWIYKAAADLAARRNADLALDARQVEARWHQLELHKWLWFLPFAELPEDAFGDLTADLKQYLNRVSEEIWALDEGHPDIDVPVCCVTGWWDRLLGTVDHYSSLMRTGNPAVRDRHRLIVGPWSHEPSTYARKFGDRDFGIQAEVSHIGLMLRWFDHTIKGIDNGLMDEPPVRLFQIGSNTWQFESSWPPVNVKDRLFHLDSGGAANTAYGDGVLGEVAAEDDRPVDAYTYDPRDPVMSIVLPDSHHAPLDQRPNDHRRDKLVYATETLVEPLAIAGTPILTLFAATDCPDTDWVARLIDVEPDGKAIAIAEGILRASFREGYSPQRVPRGEVVRYELELSPIYAELQPGHRLRLDITSSDFPNFDRNHNTGRDFGTDATLQIASQRIFHDRRYPTTLKLPLLAGSAATVNRP